MKEAKPMKTTYAMRKLIAVGDTVTIKAQGITITGRAVYVDYWEGDGWDIEMTDCNIRGGYSHWKQIFDGGSIVAVNGKVWEGEQS